MPELQLLEHHPQRVLEAFRQGEFDQIEIIGQADEKDFFELCLRERLLGALAKGMPTARQKIEVPLWFILAANLSLKLHVENAFHGFERVVRCGGLLSALDPALATKHLDPKTKAWVLSCQGFNHKNHYERATPCDQDALRKALKDVPAQQWLDWFNGPVQKVFQQYGFFDPAGVFIGDASYLFVPNNPAYEGSELLWFDEHNHPVNYDELSPDQRKWAHLERCYKWVSLLHLRGQCYVYAGAALINAKRHESPVFYQLVEQFVATVGKGVMKQLILDRGFIDGPAISHCKTDLGLDVLIPLKKNMDIWHDAWALGQTQPWQLIPPPVPSPPPVPAQRPEALQRREAKRQQTLAARKAAPPPPPPDQVVVRRELCPIKGFTSWSAATVPIHVLLLRETYADGHQEGWGLMNTADFHDPLRPKQDYGLRTHVEERHRQIKCFYDLTDFRSRSLAAITAQVVMVLLAYTLRQWQLWKRQQEQLSGRTPELLRQQLAIHQHWVVIYHQRAYAQMPLVSFARELAELEAAARAKVLAKLRHLEQSLLCPTDLPRPPQRE
jgi:hypothetical protein